MITYVETKYPIFCNNIAKQEIYKQVLTGNTTWKGRKGKEIKIPKITNSFVIPCVLSGKTTWGLNLEWFLKLYLLLLVYLGQCCAPCLFFLSSLKNNQWLSDKWTIHMFFILLVIFIPVLCHFVAFLCQKTFVLDTVSGDLHESLLLRLVSVSHLD